MPPEHTVEVGQVWEFNYSRRGTAEWLITDVDGGVTGRVVKSTNAAKTVGEVSTTLNVRSSSMRNYWRLVQDAEEQPKGLSRLVRPGQIWRYKDEDGEIFDWRIVTVDAHGRPWAEVIDQNGEAAGGAHGINMHAKHGMWTLLRWPTRSSEDDE